MQKAYKVIAVGRVQAVGFRRAVQELAKEHKLAGSVQNLEDGNVEIFIQGEDSVIDAFLGKIRLSSPPIKVSYLEKTEIETDPKQSIFKVIRGEIGEEIDEGLGAGVQELKLLRGDLNQFKETTKEDFQNLAKRYDSISDTLAKVVEQSAESSNELKRALETLVKSLENLTTLASNYFEERRRSVGMNSS